MKTAMKEMEKISIIIPVYNGKKYLPSCLKSVFNQTYKNIEIILIDDGSTDGSGELCDKYAAQFGNIRVCHQNNKGPGAARNLGLSIMTGDYLTYIDADDYVSEKYVETLYELLRKYEADIAEVGLVCLEASHNDFECSDGEVECFDGADFLIQDYFSAEKRIRNCIAGRMYRMDKFRDIRFSEKYIGEDSEYSLKMLGKCGRLVKYHKCLYACRAYHESLTRKSFGKKQFDILDILFRDACYADASGIEPIDWKYISNKFLNTCYQLLGTLAVQKNQNDYRAELIHMLSVYKNMKDVVQKHGIQLSEQLPEDIRNFNDWAKWYRKKNSVNLVIKWMRSCVSGFMGAVKVQLRYEYKF